MEISFEKVSLQQITQLAFYGFKANSEIITN